jgi:multiple sugar transport system permease protein
VSSQLSAHVRPLDVNPQTRAPIVARRRKIGRRSWRGNVVLAVGLVFFFVFTMFPIVYMVSGSFKSLSEILSGFPSLIPSKPTIDNFSSILNSNSLTQTNFLLNAGNSLAIAGMTIAFSSVVGVPAAYVLARRTGFMSTAVRSWIRLAQIASGIIVIIPLYGILKDLGLIDNLLGVSLAETVPCSAFTIWVLVSFIRQVPIEIEEAARMDGASTLQVLRRIILPLVRPGLLSVVLVVFVLSWDDFLNPLILLTSGNLFTVTLGLFTFIGQVGQVEWGTLLAYSTLACIPPVLVIAFAERHLVRGLIAGTGK